MITMLVYLAILGAPVAAFWIGWFARGIWDKAARKAEELAELPPLPQRHRKGPVSDEEWDEIVQTIKEDR